MKVPGCGVVRGGLRKGVPPGFHQGSTRVPPGFHHGSTRVPGFYEGSTSFLNSSTRVPHAGRVHEVLRGLWHGPEVSQGSTELMCARFSVSCARRLKSVGAVK